MLSEKIKTDRVMASVVAGTSDQTTSVVDMAGYEGVRFIVLFGAITSGAVTSIKVQQGQASNMSDAADLLGSAITVADTNDDKAFITEVYRPRERYVQLVVDRGTQNAVIDGVIVEQYGAKTMPVTDGSGIVSREIWTSPAEGTA